MKPLALVVGSAACVWQDVAAAQSLATFAKIYCVKQAGIHWRGHFDVWVTLHPEAMDDYEAQRKAFGFQGGYEIVAPPKSEVGMHGEKGRIDRRVSYQWPDVVDSAASGLYGAKVAIEDGFKVILAGIPMTKDGGHFLPETKNVYGHVRGNEWKQVVDFERGFQASIPHLIGHVKSMSGRTREVLGEPTQEWLAA